MTSLPPGGQRRSAEVLNELGYACRAGYTRLAGPDPDPRAVVVWARGRIIDSVPTTRAARRLLERDRLKHQAATAALAEHLSQHTATRQASRAALLASVDDVRATVEQRLRDLGAE